MVKIFKYGLVLLLFYFIFILALLPASFVVNTLEEQRIIPRDVRLGHASGSIWQGNLSSVMVQGIQLEQVRWEMSALSILTGHIKLDINVGKKRSAIRANGQLIINHEGVMANDVSIKSPLAPLVAVNPLPYGLTSTGNIDINITHYTQDQPWCETLSGKVTTSDLLIKSAFGQLAVDNVSAALTCPQGKLMAKLTPSTNSLGIDGELALTKDKQYQVNAKVLPPVGASQDYINVLKFSGTPNSQGHYIFRYNGSL